MMLHLSSSSAIRNRPRSNSHPVRPQRDGRLPEAEESFLPLRPARNPSRPTTFGEGQLVPPSPFPGPKLTRAPEDNDDCWEGGREIGPEERYRQSVNVPPPKSPVNKKHPPQAPLPQINTLDRKILQELQRTMLARSAQFTVKKGTKHHPFPPEEVPYPRSYDHKCIDTDVWETLFCEQFCGDVTFHSFDVPPTKVLDLGCGSGSWIMSCARRWKNCHFVGFDIVPLHPDLGQLELSQRVKWIQGNFLERLPFQNEEFDFVHIKRIARGVPENKWDALFEEITRVMKPGAVLEMLEEDLYIPGQMIDSADNGSPLSAAHSSGSSDGLSQSPVSSTQGPSTSLPDVLTGRGSSQMIRRSTSDKVKRSPVSPTTSNTLPSPPSNRPTPPTPDYSRVFPRPKPPKSAVRPATSHFNLHNLLQKRSGRDDKAGTDGEQSRKNKKETAPSVSSSAGLYTLSSSSSSTAVNQKRLAEKAYRPASPGARLPPPKLYCNTSGTSSNLILGSNTSINILPVPPMHKPSARADSPTLPQMESTNGKLEVDFPQHEQARVRSFSYPTQEDDRHRWSSASGESEAFDLSTIGMHDHVQQVRSRNSGVPTEAESTELNRRDRASLAILQFPLPPPRDIPVRSKPQGTPFDSWPNEASSSTNGLPRSAPDRVTDYSDRTGDKVLSPTLEGTAPKPIKSLSTSSLSIQCASPSVRYPVQEIPPNPRQHGLLEVIYSEMHAARFVNLAPLSLLENYLQTYFKNVRTHAPLIFAFPPPPGCDHRPEFDALELQKKMDRTHGEDHDDDQDRYLGPDTPPSLTPKPSLPQLNAFKTIPPRPTRERSRSVTTREPGPSRARSSSIKATRPFAADPEASNHRQPRPSGSNLFVGPANVTVSDRLVVTGDGLLSGTSEYVMMDRSMVGGLSPARVAKAARESASSASEERECRHRSDSLFTRSNDVKGKRAGGEARKRSLGQLPPPSSFEYRHYNSASSTSLSPSIAPSIVPSVAPSVASSSSSTSTIVQHDSGKGRPGFTVPEGANLGPFPGQNAEIDIRSLNLHLRVRVVEILGCSEAMWDWVKEFQRQEREKEKKRKEQQKPRTRQGVGGGRVSYFHHDHARTAGARGRMNSGGSDNSALRHKRSTRGLTVGAGNEKRGDDAGSVNGNGQGTFVKVSGYMAESPTSYFTTSFGSVKEDDPSERVKKVKQELLHMTRERFDEALSWFQYDMDDSIRLTRSMATRTPSSPFPTDPTEQRKTFDVACHKLETYLQQHPGSPTSFVKPGSIVSGKWSGSSSSGSQQSEEELCCLPPLLNLVHPSKRLCRTIRVWVAWKP